MATCSFTTVAGGMWGSGQEQRVCGNSGSGRELPCTVTSLTANGFQTADGKTVGDQGITSGDFSKEVLNVVVAGGGEKRTEK